MWCNSYLSLQVDWALSSVDPSSCCVGCCSGGLDKRWRWSSLTGSDWLVSVSSACSSKGHGGIVNTRGTARHGNFTAIPDIGQFVHERVDSIGLAFTLQQQTFYLQQVILKETSVEFSNICLEGKTQTLPGRTLTNRKSILSWRRNWSCRYFLSMLWSSL